MSSPTKYVSLEAGVPQTIEVYRPAAKLVAVCNFTGTGEIFFRIDGGAVAVRGDGCEGVPAVTGQEVHVVAPRIGTGTISVSLIASAPVVALVRAVS